MKNARTEKLPRFLTIVVLGLGLALLAMACGETAEAPEEGVPTAGAQADTFDISLEDNLFEPNEFTVAPGQRVTFNIANDGAAIHSMRIAGSDGEFNTDDDAVSDPEMVNPGDDAALTWTVPDEPGTIDFRCDFHPADQTGAITVQ